MPNVKRWSAVLIGFMILLLGLFACAPDTNVESVNSSTPFPTATLHPVFSSGTEFGNLLSETRAIEATEDALDKPTKIPRPTTTESISISATVGSTPTPVVSDSRSDVLGETIDVPILLYHHVGSPSDNLSSGESGYDYFVSVEEFEAHIAFLDESGYTPIDLYELYEGLQDTAELPSNPVLITFDDGYADVYENAFPILQDYGFIATFFIITDFIETGREGYLTWEQIDEMAADGMRFESHSSSHADLRGQMDDFLIRQILDSQEVLTQHLGYTPRFIAYPFGRHDDAIIQFLEENDFWGGVTAEGSLEVALDNRFIWPRLFITADTPIDSFASILDEGQTLSIHPEIVENLTASWPVTVSVSISTTLGAITTSGLLVYDEGLNRDWTVKTSPEVEFNLEDDQISHGGNIALSYKPNEDFGSLFLQVRPDTSMPYLRDEVVGVAFYLYTGDEPLATDDLGLVVTGSNEFPYWSAVDESIDLDEYEPTFEDERFSFGFNDVISETMWVQVVLFFGDLGYDTDYMYITGLNIVNNVDVSRTFFIDELVLLLREP